jgi:hypothetical protein
MTGWFRVWEDMADDPKWGAVGKAARVPPGLVLGLAIKLLTRASTHNERGSIAGYNVDALAYAIGCKAAKVEAMIAGMKMIGVIVDDRFVAWDKRQPKREDNSADRVRAHRERAKSAAAEAVTQRNAPEADADTDKKAAAAAPARTAEPMLSGADNGNAAAAASVNLGEKRDRDRRSTVREAAVRLHSWVCERTRAPNGWRHELGIVEGWLDAGFDGETEIQPAREVVLAREHGQLPNSLRYFEGAIRDQRVRGRRSPAKAPAASKPAETPIDWSNPGTKVWRQKLGAWARMASRRKTFDQEDWPEWSQWPSRHPIGPPPFEPGCRAPPELVDEALRANGFDAGGEGEVPHRAAVRR